MAGQMPPDLTSLNIRIISYSGNVESRTINAPVPNTTWQFTYATSNSANRVNIGGVHFQTEDNKPYSSSTL